VEVAFEDYCEGKTLAISSRISNGTIKSPMSADSKNHTLRARVAEAGDRRRREFHIYVLRRDDLMVPHAASEADNSRQNFQSFLKSYARE
jgi:hypothetical protein